MSTTSATVTMPVPSSKSQVSYDINLPYSRLSDKERIKGATRYAEFERLPMFDFRDPALRADKAKSNLLKDGVSVSHLTPKMGSILHGVQLTTLGEAAKDELALLISERKVLVFPGQDFIDAGPEYQQSFMDYFGKANYQPVSGSIKGHPGFHIIHRDGNKEEIERFFEQKTTSTLWHQDVSYEIQPPGYVMLGLLQGPEVGGDTVFAATDEAYRRLSPTFRSMLDDLKAVHSSAKMIEHVRAVGGLVRKDPVESIHPVVRVHPITGTKCLFINGEFITGIEGMKDVESRMLLDFLLQHIITGHDFQVRVAWQPKTVVLFDNRSTLHSAIVDYVDEDYNASARHIFRLAAMAEVPIAVKKA